MRVNDHTHAGVLEQSAQAIDDEFPGGGNLNLTVSSGPPNIA